MTPLFFTDRSASLGSYLFTSQQDHSEIPEVPADTLLTPRGGIAAIDAAQEVHRSGEMNIADVISE